MKTYITSETWLWRDLLSKDEKGKEMSLLHNIFPFPNTQSLCPCELMRVSTHMSVN